MPFPELAPFVEGDYTIDGLNWLAARLGELDAADMQTVRAAIVAGGLGTPVDVVELTHNTEYYILLAGAHDRAALGRYYLNDSSMAYDELGLDTLGDQKTALFFITRDTNSTFDFLIALALSQMFNLLCEKADYVYGGRLPVHVRCL